MNPTAALRSAVLPLVALIAAGCATNPRPITFPGDGTQAVAPGDRGSITSFDRPGGAEGGEHHELFYRTPSGDLIPMLSYSGEAQALWSAPGDYAAITRWKGVGEADCLIFDTRTRRLTDATPQLEAAIPGLARMRASGRCAIQAVRWTRRGDLEVRIDGSAPGMPDVRGMMAVVRIARSLGQ